ncbi:BON domain-containing protein [Oscillatoria laete-virens NRMC-F 0139]|nr:BON domain-containing protein [Oscillatoria laete-virens]MDL5054296.1 BON domain-containing protein [Oscillatoria laete-virens NRMC-F 0139]
MSESIVSLMERLPSDNITVKVLRALDFVVPGQWNNIVGFDATIRSVTGETDPGRIQQIRDRATLLYQDPKEPYQFAVRLYQTIDKADIALGTAAMANKVGEKIGFLSVLNQLTPKADVLQSVDLGLKIAVELLAFSRLNGISPNPSQFANALSQNYQDAALMRMAALVCIDAVLPLGPNFLSKIHSVIDNDNGSVLEQNPAFAAVSSFIPGENNASKLGFVRESLNAVQGWMNGFVARTGVTPQSIISHLGNTIQFADDKLDFVAAFLDQTTNYFEHTGIQTVAKSLVVRANSLVDRQQTPIISQSVQSPNIPPERIGTDGQYHESGLAQRVERSLRTAGLNSVWVAQTGGTVVLKGQVKGRSELDRAIAIAKSEKGCAQVNSEQLSIS